MATYASEGFSCMEGQFTLKAFFFAGPGQGGLLANQISVSPVGGQNQIGLQVSGAFTAGANQTLSYIFDYLIDPPPIIIRGEQIDVDPAILTTTLCPSINNQGCGDTAFPFVLVATTNNPTASITFPSPANTLALRNTFTLAGNTTAGGFDNITLLSASVPEPAGIALVASGLLGLLAFRVRAKLRQVLLELPFQG